MDIVNKSRTMKASRIKIDNENGMLNTQLKTELDLDEQEKLRKKSQEESRNLIDPMQINAEPQKSGVPGGTLVRVAGITGTPVVTQTPPGYIPHILPGRKTETINYMDPKNL